MPFAHSPNDAGEWHDLTAHLTAVAEKAAAFAEPFHVDDLAYWLGLWHDLGKVNPEFQSYLLARTAGVYHSRVPHAIWGAALAYAALWRQLRMHEHWQEAVLPIAGHHAGLGHGGEIAQACEQFLSDHPDALAMMGSYASTLPKPPSYRPHQLGSTSREMYIRMLFSALVDADYLDTERHFNPDQQRGRIGGLTLPSLWERFEGRQRTWMAGKPATPVNDIRREIYDACVAAAINPRGVFRLTVPTGGGKTRSGLAFALKHAYTHAQLRRIVVAIPYTSIIEQTAGEYRDILGDDAVLEHHSQFVPPEDESVEPAAERLRLATENWDTSVIVTTTVQLFESLLSNRPGQVRKLHNLANSIILLDEVQTLPVELLTPTLDVLRTLVEQYGVTLILSTATQPALEASRFLEPFQGLAIREIVPDYPRHFEILRRVQYQLLPEPLSTKALAEQIRPHEQILVVLNTRRDALNLLEALGDVPNTFHLSTLLCGAHRRRVLATISERLKQQLPILLISTQVVEAGVDLDFPTVWRVIGPLDRIVQAAGRCNREGKLGREQGKVVIFELARGGSPHGSYHAAIVESRAMLARYGASRLSEPGIYQEFFANLFAIVPLDKRCIQAERISLNYPEVAHRYRLIDDDTVPIIVEYEDSLQRLKDWRARPSREAWRRLQPYLVNVPAREIYRLQSAGQDFETISDNLYRWRGSYDERTGLQQVLHDPSDLR